MDWSCFEDLWMPSISTWPHLPLFGRKSGSELDLGHLGSDIRIHVIFLPTLQLCSIQLLFLRLLRSIGHFQYGDRSKSANRAQRLQKPLLARGEGRRRHRRLKRLRPPRCVWVHSPSPRTNEDPMLTPSLPSPASFKPAPPKFT